MKIKLIGLSALLIASSLPSYSQQEREGRNENTGHRKLHDSDGDGWCDLWCALHPELKHRNKKIDTDGDGVTDYQEMLLMQNASVADIPPEQLTPEEERQAALAAQERRVERQKEWIKRKAILEKTLVEGFASGKRAADPDSIRPDNAEWRKRLQARRDAASAKSLQKEATLNRIAAKYGIKRSSDRGTLVGDSEHGPIFASPQDAISANTIFADDLWPTQPNGDPLYPWQDTTQSRNLTGQGIKVSIWEANEAGGNGAGLLETHSEFGPNRANLEDTTPLSHHATAVANTIVGAGNLDVFLGGVNEGRLLRGVAYEGEVDGYDLADFETETTDAVLDGQIFSNHSYGINGGWELRQVGATIRWYWAFPNFDEDPRLGLYSPSLATEIGSVDFDNFVHTSKVHLPVISSGNPNNDGPGQAVSHVIIVNNAYQNSTATRDWTNGEDSFDSVISPATAKNVLSVGSILDISGPNIFFSDFSGSGPTDDGRIKPDVVAVGEREGTFGFGDSLLEANRNTNFSYYNGVTPDSLGTTILAGTSFAAPSVTGGLMLAEERRLELFPTASPLLASTWRAAAINTVFALGNGGPNYRSGWGIFNAVNLVELLENDEDLGRGSLIKEFTVHTGVTKSFYVTIPANAQADLTLAWSDPAGNPPAFATVVDDNTAMLVNNLDLVVEDETTSPVTTHFPWTLNPDFAGQSAAVRGAPAERDSMDDRNNVEKVTIDSDPQERRLKISVAPNGTLQGGSQEVSLILTGVELDAPQIVSSGFTQNPTNANEFALTINSDPGAFYTLETSSNLQGSSWTDVLSFKAEDSTTTVLTNRNTAQNKQFWRVRRGD